MTTYIATISHHSISRARTIEINGTLAQAKRAASAEFGEDHRDYTILIVDGDNIVASRRVGGKQWANHV